jgi:hypothetical protein
LYLPYFYSLEVRENHHIAETSIHAIKRALNMLLVSPCPDDWEKITKKFSIKKLLFKRA